MKSLKENWLVVLVAGLLGFSVSEGTDFAQLIATGDKAPDPKIEVTDDGAETDEDLAAQAWRVYYTVAQRGTPNTYETFSDVEYVGPVPVDTAATLVNVPDGYKLGDIRFIEHWPPGKKK